MIKGFKLFGMWVGFWWYTILADATFGIYNRKLCHGKFDDKIAKASIRYDGKATGMSIRIDKLKESLN